MLEWLIRDGGLWYSVALMGTPVVGLGLLYWRRRRAVQHARARIRARIAAIVTQDTAEGRRRAA